MSPCLTSQLPSIYAATAQFVKYLQAPACPCCFFLSFADHSLPRQLRLEIALPNIDVHPCTKWGNLFFLAQLEAVCAELLGCVQGQWVNSSSSVLGREAELGSAAAALSIPPWHHQPQVLSWNPCWSVQTTFSVHFGWVRLKTKSEGWCLFYLQGAGGPGRARAACAGRPDWRGSSLTWDSILICLRLSHSK